MRKEEIIFQAGFTRWRAIVSINEEEEKTVIAVLSMPGNSIKEGYF